MKKCLLLLLVVIMAGSALQAQQDRPFYHDIESFLKADSVQAPPQKAILFVGSSSFRMWNDVQQDFPKHTIINRGFGGSSLPHLVQYADEIIFPYNAKQIVIYAGENDFAAHDSVSAQTVFNRFQQLFYLIRERQPKVPLVFVSIKPSPSRAHLMPKMAEANRMIAAFLKKQKKAKFVDVYSLMLNEQGKPMADIYLNDSLHMNRKGYAIWQKALEPYLK